MGKKKQFDSRLKKNDECVVTIEDIGSSGEGIGRINGYALFVKDALPGDVVRVKVMRTKRNYGYAKLVEVLKPSKNRIKPKCMVARSCGGCQLQHMEYHAQLKWKEGKVENCLKRIGGFSDVDIEPIIGMENAFRYRNKAQFPVGRGKKGQPVIGFYAERTHSIVESDDCMIQAECNREIVERVRRFMVEYGVLPYVEEEHSGLVRHVLIRVGYRTGEVMVCLVVNGRKLPHGDRLVEELSRLEWELGKECKKGYDCEKGYGKVNKTEYKLKYKVKSVCLNINMEKTNVILGKEVIPLWGDAYITDYIGDFKYHISPISFYQVNPKQTELLYGKVLEYADLTGNEVVWDLYCGIGTISLFLAKKAKFVYGVEVVSQAIEDANENARINGITNVEFYEGKAEEVLNEKGKVEGDFQADVVVLDPPRKGCEESLLQAIADSEAGRVVYVSCDPATIARDLRYLCERGYGVERVQPVDMFPMGVHVETVVQLSRRKGTPKIEVKMDVQDGDIPELKKPTYKQIQEYVMDKYGVHVHSRYIAEVKRMCGLHREE